MRIYVPVLAVFFLVAGFCWAGNGAAFATVGAPASGTASATTLSLSGPTAVYGDEQAEQFTATVSGAGGTPSGTVTVSDGVATVCTISLAGGTGSCAPTADQIPVGTVTMTAAYGGDGTFDPSSSSSAGLQITSPPPVTPAATTTALELSPAGITYGDEQAEKLTVTVTSPGITGTSPAGIVTIRSGSTSLCEFSLSSSGNGTCGLTSMTFPPGTVKLTASYAGDTAFGPSDSGAERLAVAREPTASTVSLSAGKVVYGAEQRERISAAVEPAYGGTPTGRVTIKAGGSTLRIIALASGKVTYILPATRLDGGIARLTASYDGDARYAGSASAATRLTVARASSKTTLSLSAGQVSYGAEQHERITAAVRLAHGGTPTGHVTIKAGRAIICVITLKSATGTCAPPATRLAVGRYAPRAAYGGSGSAIPSASAARRLSAVRTSSKTELSLSSAKVQYGSEGSEKITVRVAPRFAGTPGGEVSVKTGGKTLAVITLKSGEGSYTLPGKRLAAGTYTLVATYSGSADFQRSTSVKRSLRVSSPPPPPPACYPLTSGGNCYEPGEYCPDRDHGLKGIAGDGEPIICADNDGWRWEPLNNVARSAIIHRLFAFPTWPGRIGFGR